jgi:hypothetical protein
MIDPPFNGPRFKVFLNLMFGLNESKSIIWVLHYLNLKFTVPRRKLELGITLYLHTYYQNVEAEQ